MTPKKTLAVTELGTLTVQTVGAFDPYGGETYLPPPRAYLAVWVLWGILGGLAELGGAWARWAANLSILVFLTSMVLGRFGPKAVAFLERVAGASGPPPAPATPPAANPFGGRLRPTQARRISASQAQIRKSQTQFGGR